VVLVDIRAVLAESGLTTVDHLDAIHVLEQRPGRVVARAATTTGLVVVKASTAAKAFLTEVAAISRLAFHGLPVADIIGHALGPPSYLILSWTEGSAVTSQSPLGAQRAVGELLRRLHAIGREPDRDERLFPGNTTWDGWMAGWLNTALTWWATVDPLGQQRTPRAWDWFHRLAPLLATRGEDLILFDGRPAHILIRGDAIAGLIDVAELRTGDAAMDLGVLAVTDPALLAGALEGYRPDPHQRAAFALLVPFYTFLRAISQAQWHQRFGSADELMLALQRVASMEIPA
jgi:Ser/Thr protein kinase RdoA (MazF antagonist)